MATFGSLYNKIEYNIKTALLRLTELQKENARLREEKEGLMRKNEELQRQVVDMEDKMKLLIITKTVFDKQDKKETKKQINDWVREIDNCITLLTNK